MCPCFIHVCLAAYHLCARPFAWTCPPARFGLADRKPDIDRLIAENTFMAELQVPAFLHWVTVTAQPCIWLPPRSAAQWLPFCASPLLCHHQSCSLPPKVTCVKGT